MHENFKSTCSMHTICTVCTIVVMSTTGMSEGITLYTYTIIKLGLQSLLGLGEIVKAKGSFEGIHYDSLPNRPHASLAQHTGKHLSRKNYTPWQLSEKALMDETHSPSIM